MGVPLGVVVVAAAVFWAATPHGRVASGCFWWSARLVGDATAGSRGCVRGYVREGGELAEGSGAQDYALSYTTVDPDHVATRSCNYAPGEAVVARYHAVFDDGRTLIVIDDCG